MQYITTTDLRTKTTELVKTLKNKGKVSLIHRSKVIGEIKPVIEDPKPFDAEAFSKLVEALDLPPTTPAQREKRYRAHLMKKYGKNLR